MARLRKQGAEEQPYDEIGREVYGHLLTDKARFPWKGTPWEPVRIGPTWQTTDEGRWLLPERTLGWHVLGWCWEWLHNGEEPWTFTGEQARFVLWWYATDGRGRFLYQSGVLQRLRGWGKDPLAACLCLVEMFGPCRFDKRVGARVVPDAWVQTVAVSKDQTKNLMRFLPLLAGPLDSPFRRRYGVEVGRTVVHGVGDSRTLQAVTSSPESIRGGRTTFVLMDETCEWDEAHDGHAIFERIEDNTTKVRARALAITNAYEPSRDTVAQRTREAWEKIEAGQAADVGILYDSLEAPPDAPLALERREDETDEEFTERRRQVIGSVIQVVRGDSVWLDIETIVNRVLDIRNSPSSSRREWYNQITAAEDAVFSPQEWDGAADTTVTPQPEDEITMGLDPSEADDHTALIGCLVAEDHLFEIAYFTPDPKTGLINKRAVDRAVRAAFEMYDVVGFYSDVRPFESYIDGWEEDFGEQLCAKSSARRPIAWDMRQTGEEGGVRARLFTEACMRFVEAIIESSKGGKGPRLTHDGSKRFRLCALNAYRWQNKWGFTVRKEARGSQRKIDAIPAAILARLARMEYLALPPSRRRKKRSGKVW